MAGPREHQRLARAGWIGTPRPYASNRGCALLVRRGNPLRVHTVADLLRDEVRVALSSPDREPASHASYAATLQAQGGPDTVARILAKPGTWMPQRVHHREAPQALADGLADVAPLYSHLASYLSEQMPGLFETVGLPSEGNHCDELSVAPLIGAANAANGAAWSDFLCSAPAAAILQRHGFDPARG
jgi:ABC-type sulfate transport system substrate-binding protein